MKKRFQLFAGIVLVIAAWVWITSSPIDAVHWEPSGAEVRAAATISIEPENLTLLSMQDSFGPEDLTVDAFGSLYASSANGFIVKKSSQHTQFTAWCATNGFPLGLRFDGHGNLIVADAMHGLLSITPDCEVTVLVDTYQGVRLGFVDAVAIAQNGTIYFTDASAKFTPRVYTNPTVASHLDLLEHGGHGRVFAYTPNDRSLELLANGLQFANGIVVSYDQKSLLVNETGNYRILKIPLSGHNKGKAEVLVDNLPGFPDNLSLASDGGYWVGLAAPRSGLLDALAAWPRVRNLIATLPLFMQPQPARKGHLLKVNQHGMVVLSIVELNSKLTLTTGVFEYKQDLYITSLTEPHVAVINSATISL